MPRLLLVDDNPSIHKIAETLLAPTDIELVCVESAKDALNLVAQGQHFDVALLDTAMPQMDGWELLDQFRLHPATAGMPIAMMAGVLDTVDPSQFEHPSIQGFLRKPVELRDLGTRVHALLQVPMAGVAPRVEEFSPFSTMPAVKLSELGQVAKAAPLPEPIAEPASEPAVEPDPGLLVLEETDLWPEAPVPAGTRTEDLSPFSEIPPEAQLDLEEFDFDSLRNLTVGAPAELPEPAPIPAPLPSAFEMFAGDATAPVAESVLAVPSGFEPLQLEAPTPEFTEEADQGTPVTQELPDLGPEAEPTFEPAAFDAFEDFGEPLAAPQATIQPESDFLSDLGEVSSSTDVAIIDWSQSHPAATEVEPTSPAFVADHSETEPAAPVPPTPVPPALVPQASPDALLQALLADPAALDQLAKAVVARLGDQALREIAWEIMPELAERLNRH